MYCLWEGKAKEAKYLYSIAQSMGEQHFACDHHQADSSGSAYDDSP